MSHWLRQLARPSEHGPHCGLLLPLLLLQHLVKQCVSHTSRPSAPADAGGSVLIMWRVLRSTEPIEHTGGGELYPRKSLNRIVRWRVLEALIQSAAVYSAASVALVVTCFVDKEVEYFPCLSFFSPFIVRATQVSSYSCRATAA